MLHMRAISLRLDISIHFEQKHSQAIATTRETAADDDDDGDDDVPLIHYKPIDIMYLTESKILQRECILRLDPIAFRPNPISS